MALKYWGHVSGAETKAKASSIGTGRIAPLLVAAEGPERWGTKSLAAAPDETRRVVAGGPGGR
jgi:hypothetical protein